MADDDHNDDALVLRTVPLTYQEPCVKKFLPKIIPSFEGAHVCFNPTPVVSSYGDWNRNTPILLEVPANPAERSSRQNLLPLLPPQHPPPRHPNPTPRASEPRASQQHSARVLGEPSKPAGLAKAFPTIIQKGRTTPGETQTCPTPVHPQPGCLWPCLDPLGPTFVLICALHAHTSHSQPSPGRITDPARGLGEARAQNTCFHPWSRPALCLWTLVLLLPWAFLPFTLHPTPTPTPLRCIPVTRDDLSSSLQ